MIEFNFTIGIMLLILNSSILLTLFIGIYYRSKSLHASTNKKDFDMHFMVLFASMVFLFSNAFALYTGYKYYIRGGAIIIDESIVIARLIDRVGMLAVSVLFIFIGKKIPKNIMENENK